jgi:hypothetical protein
VPGVPESHLRRLEEQIEELKQENSELRAEVLGAPHPDVLVGCFPEQLAFIRDQSPKKWAFCTRRAAKSYSVALDMIDDSFNHPYAHYLILGLHRLEIKDIYWDNILKAIDRKFGLHARFNESELTMRMPNGALIRLAGADANEDEKNKFLGGKKRKVAVDEGQAFGTDLRELVYAVLQPTVTDYGGQIIVVGTPGNLYQGFFRSLTNGTTAGRLSSPAMREPGWSGHTWTTFQNTSIVDGVAMNARWERQIAELKEANPLVVEVPWFKQMYLGEWVIDLDALCYKFSLTRNGWNGELPKYADGRGQWHYVLAIDLGYSPDPSAFVVYAYHDHDPNLYMLESWKQWRMDITDVADKVKLYEQRYTFDAHVIDGANKQAVEEMRRRHSLPFLDADKRGKSDFIELMNAEFILGRIKVNVEACNQGRLEENQNPDRRITESLSIVDEWAGLIWDPRKLALNKREEHPGCPNHLADAGLYGWRHCYQYLSKAPEKPPAPFSKAWYDAEIARMRQQAQEEMEARKHEAGDEQGLPDPGDWETWAQ